MDKKEIAERIIAYSHSLIGQYVADTSEYNSDVYSICGSIEAPDYFFELLKMEQQSYSEARTLQIASILFDAAKLPIAINGIHYDFPDSAIRRKPALFFYERAADRGSIKAMGMVAFILNSGCGDIPKNPQRSQQLYTYAAEHGDLMSLRFSHFSSFALKRMASSGNIMALIVLFEKHYRKNRKFLAKRCIDKFLKACSEIQKNDVIEWMKEEIYFADYSSVIPYVMGKTRSFQIKKGVLG